MTLQPSTIGVFRSIPDNQIVISSFSLTSAMCMTSLGAKSDTLEEINNVFQCKHPEIQLLVRDMTSKNATIANALFPAQNLFVKPKFVEDVKKYYDAEVLPQDFSKVQDTVDNINSFISKKTNRRIEKILEPHMINSDKRIVLVNTLDLKFQWRFNFNPALTSPKSFRLVSNEDAKVEMMKMDTLRILQYKIYGNEAEGIVLPSHDNDFSMEFIIPKSRDPRAIFAIETLAFSAPTSDEMVDVLSIQIPKFDFTYFLDLKESLKKSGITKAFDERLADFSGMSDEKLCISDVFQKSRITVDEKGVAASAATTVIGEYERMPMGGKRIVVDRPFIAHIRYKDTILFSMRILDPRKKEN